MHRALNCESPEGRAREAESSHALADFCSQRLILSPKGWQHWDKINKCACVRARARARTRTHWEVGGTDVKNV